MPRKEKKPVAPDKAQEKADAELRAAKQADMGSQE